MRKVLVPRKIVHLEDEAPNWPREMTFHPIYQVFSASHLHIRTSVLNEDAIQRLEALSARLCKNCLLIALAILGRRVSQHLTFLFIFFTVAFWLILVSKLIPEFGQSWAAGTTVGKKVGNLPSTLATQIFNVLTVESKKHEPFGTAVIANVGNGMQWQRQNTDSAAIK